MRWESLMRRGVLTPSSVLFSIIWDKMNFPRKFWQVFTQKMSLKIMHWGLPSWCSIGIHLPMQGTQVPSLVWEDCTRHRETKQAHHNYWACFLKPVSHNYGSLYALEHTLHSTAREATAMRSLCITIKSSPHLLQLEKACMQQQRPSTTKNQ